MLDQGPIGTVLNEGYRLATTGDGAGSIMSDSFTKTDSPVCVVDDDASVRRSLSRLLDSDGWKVQCFERGEDFIAYAHEHLVSLAMVDMRMPGIDGMEVLSLLRNFSPATRTIIITASDDEGIREAAMKHGAAAFLSKPLEDWELLAAMHRALDAS